MDDWTSWLPFIGGAVAGLSGGDEPAGNTTTTQAPWESQQPYLQDLFNQAQGVSGYGSELTPDQISAQQAMGGWASGQNYNPLLGQSNPGLAQNQDQQFGMDQYRQWALGANQNPFSSMGNAAAWQSNPMAGQGNSAAWQTNQMAGVRNPMMGLNNPYLQNVINSSAQDAMRNMMPMMNQANAQSGSFGNSGLAEMYGRSAADTLGNIANRTRYQDYTNQQGLQEAHLGRQIGMEESRIGRQAGAEESRLGRLYGSLESQIGRQTGAEENRLGRQASGYESGLNRRFGALNPFMQNAGNQQQYGINDFNAQRQLYENDANRQITATGQFQNQANYEQNLPWNNVQNYGKTLQGSYGGSTSSPYFTNTGANILGGMGAGTWMATQFNK